MMRRLTKIQFIWNLKKITFSTLREQCQKVQLMQDNYKQWRQPSRSGNSQAIKSLPFAFFLFLFNIEKNCLIFLDPFVEKISQGIKALSCWSRHSFITFEKSLFNLFKFLYLNQYFWCYHHASCLLWN